MGSYDTLETGESDEWSTEERKNSQESQDVTTPTPQKGDNRTTQDQSLMWEKKG